MTALTLAALARAAANAQAIASACNPALAAARDKYVLASASDGQGGVTKPAVKYWLHFTLFGRGISPVRTVHGGSSPAEKADEETLLMDFATWLVHYKPGSRSISWKTARKHVSTVQAWHRRQPGSGGSIGGEMKLHRLHALFDGMQRTQGNPPKRVRFGCRTQQLRQAIDACLAPDRVPHQMWRAALTTAFCALMRGGELGCQDGEAFNAALHLTRADITFFRADGVLHARIRMRPLKKERGSRTKGTTVVLRGGGSLLDPVAELWRMLELDPVPKAERATTPLFRLASGEPVRTGDVREIVRALMKRIGCDPLQFGAHSLRIGGATAAMAAGVDAAVIKVMGRWSSDVFMIYTRINREMAARMSAVIGSTSFHDLERGVESEEMDEIVLPGAPDLVFGDDGGEDDDWE